MDMLADDVVHTLTQAVRHLDREAHLLKGFIAFRLQTAHCWRRLTPRTAYYRCLSSTSASATRRNGFSSTIKPTRWRLHTSHIAPSSFPLEALEQPEPDEEERAFRRLWQLFYDTVEVKGRHNQNVA
jgi:hypothetical protein